MLSAVTVVDPALLAVGTLPEFLHPFAEALARREPMSDALLLVVHSLGFDGFTYVTGNKPTVQREARSYVWTSMPIEWIREYDQNDYLEVDPRVTATVDFATPMPWDRYSFPETKRRRTFFDAAARFGVCSGLSLALRDPSRALSGFVLTSRRPRLDEPTLARYAAIQGQVLMLAHYVHATLTTSIVDRDVTPPTAGCKLSSRELQCLRLAAKGMSSSQIASLINISERTVHYHFGNLLSKLDSVNRHQAIAKAVAAGLVEA
jgi:LuxR family quorum-sensing system transcriptional regulator SolR